MDVERGRTIKGWKPRRLGGGKGGRKSHLDPLAAAPASVSSQSNHLERERDRDRQRDDSGRDDRGDITSRHRDRERDAKPRSRSRSRSRDNRRKRSKSRGNDHVSMLSSKRKLFLHFSSMHFQKIDTEAAVVAETERRSRATRLPWTRKFRSKFSSADLRSYYFIIKEKKKRKKTIGNFLKKNRLSQSRRIHTYI